MATFKRFEDIVAWQKSRTLMREVVSACRQGPFAKDFALRNQISRACISVMSNIAEGFERDGTKEFLQFLSVAKASAGEVRSQLYGALDQGYLSREQFNVLHTRCLETSYTIAGLIRYLRQSEIKGMKYKRSPGSGNNL